MNRPLQVASIVISILIAVSAVFLISTSIFHSQAKITGAAVAGEWWNSSWEYRVPIKVTELDHTEHRNSIIEFKINTFNLIPGTIKTDCGDIRIVNLLGSEIPFNLTRCGTVDTTIRFRSDIPEGFDGILAWIYYGNLNAPSVNYDIPYWLTKAPLPYKLFYSPLSAPVIDGKIYVIGGLVIKSATNPTYVDSSYTLIYDPADNIWTSGADMLTARRAPISEAVGEDRIYTIGGSNSSAGALGINEVYYPNINAWSDAPADMPSPTQVAASAVFGTKIYVFGGGATENAATNIKTLEYDVTQDKWTEKSPMSAPRTFAVAQTIGNKIYVIGGGQLLLVEEYDPATNTWTNCGNGCTNLPKAIERAASAVIDGKIYVLSGVRTKDCFVYDPKNDSWSQIPQIPTGRWTATAAAVDDKIYVIGGFWGDGTVVILDTNEEYTVTNWQMNWSLEKEQKVGAVFCTEGQTRSCSVAHKGECAKGTETCIASEWTGCPIPNNETCNKLDDDCDGYIDELWDNDSDRYMKNDTACRTSYTNYTFDCNDADASIHPGAGEICDNKDNDCDGSKDEDTSKACSFTYKGICAVGSETCTAGNWTKCPAPQTEICNKLDDNCDGYIDDPWDKDHDGYVVNATACLTSYTNYTFDCDDSKKSVHPNATESCTNNIDDDCDGQVNEGCAGQAQADIYSQTLAKYTIGNNICEPGETSGFACVDCGCPENQSCVQNKCIVPEVEVVCGNNVTEKGEACDGSDDAICPGLCTDCRCQYVVGDGICQDTAGENNAVSPSDCPKKVSFTVWVLLASLIAGVSVGGFWWFFMKPKAELTGLAEEHNVNVPEEATTTDLIKYVRECLDKGYAKEQIKAVLLTAGWKEEQLKEL